MYVDTLEEDDYQIDNKKGETKVLPSLT